MDTFRQLQHPGNCFSKKFHFHYPLPKYLTWISSLHHLQIQLSLRMVSWKNFSLWLVIVFLHICCLKNSSSLFFIFLWTKHSLFFTSIYHFFWFFVVHFAALTFNDLGIVPHKLKGYPIEYLIQYRKGGPQFGSTVSEKVSPDAWPWVSLNFYSQTL